MKNDIAIRLNTIFEQEGITAAVFADKIGVQRSAISHILSGRNKPGFDFLFKILNSYPKLNSEWLITGLGEPYKKTSSPKQQQLFNDDIQTKESAESKFTNVNIVNSFVQKGKSIERIVIFYADKTFEAYTPGE